MRYMLISVFFFWCTMAWAEDARMTVEINKQQQPDMATAAKKALPILLDRLLPRDTPMQVESIADPATLVSSLLNNQKYTQVIFHEASVVKFLKAQGVSWFEKSPRLQLRIEMLNTEGKAMVKSRLFMDSEAQKIARHWGIELFAGGTELSMRWQWQQDGMVALVVESASGSFSEQRHINLQKSVPQMKAWLQQVMLKKRDMQLQQRLMNLPDILGETVVEGQNLLEIKRQMRLEELVAFESALRSEQGVTMLTPYLYSKQQQSYKLEISTEDDGWLQRWFQRRGMQLNSTEQGWAVR